MCGMNSYISDPITGKKGCSTPDLSALYQE